MVRARMPSPAALCRLATIKALPTDAEIKAANAEHAGTFLAKLENDDHKAYGALLKERGGSFGVTRERHLQPVHRMVAHTIELIFYTIEVQVAGESSGNMELSVKEVVKWMQRKALLA